MPSFVIRNEIVALVLKNITHIKICIVSTVFLQAAQETRCATAFFSKFTGIRE